MFHMCKVQELKNCKPYRTNSLKNSKICMIHRYNNIKHAFVFLWTHAILYVTKLIHIIVAVNQYRLNGHIIVNCGHDIMTKRVRANKVDNMMKIRKYKKYNILFLILYNFSPGNYCVWKIRNCESIVLSITSGFTTV